MSDEQKKSILLILNNQEDTGLTTTLTRMFGILGSDPAPASDIPYGFKGIAANVPLRIKPESITKEFPDVTVKTHDGKYFHGGKEHVMAERRIYIGIESDPMLCLTPIEDCKKGKDRMWRAPGVDTNRGESTPTSLNVKYRQNFVPPVLPHSQANEPKGFE